MTGGAQAVQAGTLVVGGGPAGLAPLLAASARGLLPEMLSHGLVVVERSDRIGDGRLGGYVINSDSSAQTFLSCLDGRHDPRIADLANHPVTLEIARFGIETVPLALVGTLLRLIGTALAEIIAEAPGGRVMTGYEAIRTRRRPDGDWTTRLRRLADGRVTDVVSRAIVIATGGRQPDGLLGETRIGGQPLLPTHGDRLLRSDHAMTAAGTADIAGRLSAIPAPRIVVIGGASSAIACLRMLLEPNRLPADATVTLMHRSRLTLFYPSAEAAMADGYTAFGRDDICPVSGFVFRFGGLRFDSRILARRLLGLDAAAPDPRLRLHRLQPADGPLTHELAEARGRDRRVLEQAHLIVSCTGYQPRGLPVRAVDGSPLPLDMHRRGGVLAGAGCDVLDAVGEPVGGLFAIGLAAGFRPGKAMGGEPSFQGQINGLWLWQNDTGLLLAERVLAVLRSSPGLAAAGDRVGDGEPAEIAGPDDVPPYSLIAAAGADPSAHQGPSAAP